MAMMPSKEADATYESKKKNDPFGVDTNEDDDDENYEIEENEYFTTLRKSSAFTIERYSSKYDCN
jgi:hypothetical protein